MTPEEIKAEEIFNSHYLILFDSDSDKGEEILISLLAQKLALETVRIVVEQWEYIDTYLGDGRGELNPNYKFWLGVEIALKNINK